MFFSIIIPSYLGYYEGAASDRENKFKRAINSIKAQTFTDYEIIVVSDGCIITQRLCKELGIFCTKIPKQPLFSGTVRNNGLKRAKGEYIIYLDSDDYYEPTHLQFVYDALKRHGFPSSIRFADNINPGEFAFTKIGTSNICHKNNPVISWANCNGYGHDWKFIEMYLKNPIFAGKSGYVVCHVPNQLDI